MPASAPSGRALGTDAACATDPATVSVATTATAAAGNQPRLRSLIIDPTSVFTSHTAVSECLLAFWQAPAQVSTSLAQVVVTVPAALLDPAHSPRSSYQSGRVPG